MRTYDVTVTKVRDTGSHLKTEGQPHPIFEGYTLKGTVASLPIVGERWVVLRRERNGQPILGIFTTSEVKAVWQDDQAGWARFETNNSVYDVHFTLDEVPPTVLS
jgi:hypothetical protein